MRRAANLGIIAACGENGVIGRAGVLPWDIPEDRKHFLDATRGGTLIHGRRVLEELGGVPLPHCDTIVLSRSGALRVEGAGVAGSLPAALDMCDPDRPVWIGGGTEIYREALPLARKLLLTVVHTSPPGDTYFPAEWEAHFPTETSRRHASDDNYSYSFLELAP